MMDLKLLGNFLLMVIPFFIGTIWAVVDSAQKGRLGGGVRHPFRGVYHLPDLRFSAGPKERIRPSFIHHFPLTRSRRFG